MKTVEYISPTQYSKWKENPEAYYTDYLSDNRPDRFAQTPAMAVGSSFDAYVKSYLHQMLFGAGANPQFEFDTIFQAQVDAELRDWALIAGKHVFDEYKSAGCLADLALELRNAHGEPRFEFEVRGAVQGRRDSKKQAMGSVVLLGKPDVHFRNAFGATVIYDFKVNGYCTPKNPKSPKPGYLRLRSAGRLNHGQHKNCHPMMHSGTMINIGCYLENVDESWANQLSFYGWLCDEPVGSDFIVGIDQVACNASKAGPPVLRFADHRCVVSKAYQQALYDDVCEMWDVIHSDHIFRHLSKEDSAAKCELLDGMADVYRGDGTPEGDWVASIIKG